jgi:hypothetical protein
MKVGDLRVFTSNTSHPSTGESLRGKVLVITHVDTSRDAVRIMIIDSGYMDYWDKIHLTYCSKAVKDIF